MSGEKSERRMLWLILTTLTAALVAGCAFFLTEWVELKAQVDSIHTAVKVLHSEVD